MQLVIYRSYDYNIINIISFRLELYQIYKYRYKYNYLYLSKKSLYLVNNSERKLAESICKKHFNLMKVLKKKSKNLYK